MKDYYKLLGVDKGATPAQIKKAFRDMAKKYHPDVNKGNSQAEERFKKINEAYAVLSDPEKRKQYDTFGAEGFRQRYSQEDIYRGYDFSSVFSDLFGGGQGGGSDDLLSRLFGGLGGRSRQRRGGNPFGGFQAQGNPFGGAGGFPGQGGFGGFSGQGPGPMKGQDLESELVISLDEVFSGSKRRVGLQGDGAAGTTFEVSIPQGVKDGQKLKLAGKGNPGPAGMPAGDLYLKIRIAPHPQFRREGNDLYVDLEAALSTLVLGGSVEVPTPQGQLRKLKVKAGTQNGAKMRIRGAGIPAKTGAGNLFVVLIAALPETLTEEQRELFAKLKESGL